MQTNFSSALARILVYEGGRVDNPKDPGGRTAFGITQATYNSWRRRTLAATADVYGITPVEVASIYKSDYWDRVDGDDMPSGLDLCLFDAAVNSGVGAAATWLQTSLALNADGDFGPKTIAAALGCDVEATINSVCERRLGSLKRLRTWATFGRGWSARITNVRKTADSWAEDGTSAGVNHPDPVDPTSAGGQNKADVTDVVTSPVSQVTAHITTIGGAVGAAVAQGGQALAPASDAFAWLKYVLGGLTVFGAGIGMVVMLAKNWNDQAMAGTAVVKLDPDADMNFPTVSIAVTPVTIATPILKG